MDINSMINQDLESRIPLGKFVLLPGSTLKGVVLSPKFRSSEAKIEWLAGVLAWEITRLGFYGGIAYRIAQKLGEISVNYI